MLHRPVEVTGVKRTSIEEKAGEKNLAHGRVLGFLVAGARFARWQWLSSSVVVLQVWLIATYRNILLTRLARFHQNPTIREAGVR